MRQMSPQVAAWTQDPVTAADAVATLACWPDQLDLRALQAEFGSNIWIVSAPQLAANLAAWARVAGAAARIAYPVKANPSPAVLEILASLGASAECAAPAELALARRAGFAPSQLVYNSPVADIRTAAGVLAHGGTVVADSRRFLASLDLLAGEIDPDGARHAERWRAAGARVLLRVNPDLDIRYKKDEAWSELTSHAKKTGKFGVPSDEIVDAAAALRHIALDGLHAHVGTQMDHTQPFVDLARHLAALADAIHARTGALPRILDLGGGLGIPFTPADRFPSIDALEATLAPELDARFEHWFEPGHALVGNAVALLGSIASVKSVRGKRWAIADIGTDQLAKITLLDWRHQVRGPDGRPLPFTGSDSLGGPLCFSGDTLLPATNTSALAEGDPILVEHAGAYCASLANTFNGRRAGGTVVLRDDGAVVRTSAAAGTLDEPLAATHAWGLASSREPVDPAAAPVDSARVARLSSKVLREDLCHERFRHVGAVQVGPRAWEFEFDVSSPVGFVSMPLAIRLAGDAAIVAALLDAGEDTKAYPVWGTELALAMPKQVPTNAPVIVRIELSAAAREGAGAESHRQSVRFTLNGGAAAGTFALAYDRAAKRV
ncbi:MAG: hypothetical protein GC172_06975 [Phycisphaera sp.]|nr:hypothetical protein [Phycisphaera sp.]